MGTRNLTCIKKNGEYKLAKYCQWDGYLTGQGNSITEFLREPGNIEKLRDRTDSLAFITPEELKEKLVSVGADPESVFVKWEVLDAFKKKFPELHRDNGGGDILRLICESEGEFKTINDIDFAADSLFCEFAYVIDFDDNTFSWYSGFCKSPLDPNERFAFLSATADELMKDREGDHYSPVHQIGSVPLDPDKLPVFTDDE